MPSSLPQKNRSHATGEISFRTAREDDASEICRLATESGVLEANSCYCYLLMCRDFSDTCLVACCGEQIVGFVIAYRPPTRLKTVFVWQIGVASVMRRQGLAQRLLLQLVSAPTCQTVQFLEATVAPSNTASQRLFQSLATVLEVSCNRQQGFTADMFGNQEHEEEQLFRIGPFAEAPQEIAQA